MRPEVPASPDAATLSRNLLCRRPSRESRRDSCVFGSAVRSPITDIGTLASPLSTNGAAAASVMVTVSPAAVALAPAGRKTPRNGLLFFASAT